jgi:SAM-dependent methyltransferase
MAIVATPDSKPLVAAICELADFLKEDPVATAFNVGNSFFWAAEKWRETRPDTPTEIADYYRTTAALLHQLVFANYGIPHELELLARAREFFLKCETVLDLGAGIGSVLVALAGPKKVHADVGGELLAYAEWRYERAEERVELVALPDGYLSGDPFSGRRFDGVVCTEVIEHVPDPEALVAFLARVVKPGGKLLATVSFEDRDGMIPQHLNTDRWTNERFLAEVFPAHGFSPLGDDTYTLVRSAG